MEDKNVRISISIEVGYSEVITICCRVEFYTKVLMYLIRP